MELVLVDDEVVLEDDEDVERLASRDCARYQPFHSCGKCKIELSVACSLVGAELQLFGLLVPTNERCVCPCHLVSSSCLAWRVGRLSRLSWGVCCSLGWILAGVEARLAFESRDVGGRWPRFRHLACFACICQFGFCFPYVASCAVDWCQFWF